MVYDNPTGAPLTGVMGVIGGLFQPDDVRAWPAVDRSNADYRRDLEGFLRGAAVATAGTVRMLR